MSAPGIGFGALIRSVAALGPAPTLTNAYQVARSTTAHAALTTGDSLSIIGTGFVSGATLEVDGVPGYGTAFGSSTALTVSMPAHAAGAVDLRVQNPDGQFSGAFTIYYVASPATLTLGGYWEQRGDVSDYSPTDTDGAGPDVAEVWEGRASAGASSGRDLGKDFSTAPTTTTPINGGPPVVFNNVARGLKPNRPPGDFMPSASSFTFAQLIKVTAAPGVTFSGGSPVAGEKILFHTFGCVQTAITKDGVTGNVVASFQGADSVGAASAQVTGLPVGSWFLLIGRVNGTSLKLRANAGADVSATLPGTGALSSYASGDLRDADNANGTVIRDELFRTYSGALTDAECTGLYQYLSRYQYPDAGLALVP